MKNTLITKRIHFFNSTKLKIFCLIIYLVPFGINYLQAETSNSNKIISDSTSINDDKTDNDKVNNFKLAFKYGNNIQQRGKKMVVDQHYMQPSFRYSNSNGIYACLSYEYLLNVKKDHIDNIAVNVGYDKEFTDYFSASIDYSYSKYFSTKQITSGEPHTLTLDATFDNDIITLCISGIGSFGNVNDITTSLDLSHIFLIHHLFNKKDKLTIPIIVGAYAGTSNFYRDYLLVNNVKNKKGKAITANEINTEFALTSDYITTGIKYRVGFFSIGSTITYSSEFNQPKTLATSNEPVYDVTMAFYF